MYKDVDKIVLPENPNRTVKRQQFFKSAGDFWFWITYSDYWWIAAQYKSEHLLKKHLIRMLDEGGFPHNPVDLEHIRYQ